MIRFKGLPKDTIKRLEGLKEFLECKKEFLECKKEVIFAYLFGGLVKGRPTPFSDVDIAVYVKDPKRFDYLMFYEELTNYLGTNEVDLVVLNKAPISLVGRILLSKRLLIDKEPFLRHRFESLKIREFHDFQYVEREYVRMRYKIG